MCRRSKNLVESQRYKFCTFLGGIETGKLSVYFLHNVKPHKFSYKISYYCVAETQIYLMCACFRFATTQNAA